MIRMTKKVENMKKDVNTYLEEPKTLDPTVNNKKDLVKGGGGQDGKK